MEHILHDKAYVHEPAWSHEMFSSHEKGFSGSLWKNGIVTTPNARMDDYPSRMLMSTLKYLN